MKKILLHRHGAYGDCIHCSHLPRLFKEHGWDYVGISTGKKGQEIFHNNPFVDKMYTIEYGGKCSRHFFVTRLKILCEDYDEVIDLTHSLEVRALAMEGQNEYFQHQRFRNEMGKDNYYDISTKWAGHPELVGKYRGEVFYTPEEYKIVENDLLREGRFKDNFRIMINTSGTSPHKVTANAPELYPLILERYPEAVIFTTGDKAGEEWNFHGDSPRVRKLSGNKGFRQVLCMVKYMDCVIGAESGMMVGASMWDVPTIQLMTAAAIHTHCKYAKNDYSLQSPARCSPCYKGPHDYYGCPKRDDLPLCVYFNTETIMEQIGKIYAKWRSNREKTVSEVSQEATAELSAV